MALTRRPVLLVGGGIGGTTAQDGMQSDNVLALEVVTGTSEQGTCSPDRNVDVFTAVRAGLGQVAVSTRATRTRIPAPEHVRRYVLASPDWRTLLTDERRRTAAKRCDAVQGAALATPTGWQYKLDAVAPFSGNNPPDDDRLLAGLSDDRLAAQVSTLPYFDDLNRLATLEQRLRSNGQWFSPQMSRDDWRRHFGATWGDSATPSNTLTRGTSSLPATRCSHVCCTGGGWSGKSATTARCVPNIHASKRHDYPQHIGSSDSHPRPHRTLGHVRARTGRRWRARGPR
jgi:FAD/FMN-containing dehydrogenase